MTDEYPKQTGGEDERAPRTPRRRLIRLGSAGAVVAASVAAGLQSLPAPPARAAQGAVVGDRYVGTGERVTPAVQPDAADA